MAFGVGRSVVQVVILGFAAGVVVEARSQTTQPAPMRPDAPAEVWIAVEGQRGALVERLWKRHAEAAQAAGVPEAQFRAVLSNLKPERLVVALAAEDFAELTALAADESGWTQHAPVAKDGSGSGAGSWIGYTAGGNQATGTSSAVAAGANNLASGQNAFVGAGFANQANGLSSLVIGGFDNRAVGTDALVASGAGNRAIGARAVVMGGGYNLASGNFSFIGGGGRDGVASTAAGTNVLDHIASGKWSTIGGGTGNRAGDFASTVAGGIYNIASGSSSTIGGGSQNEASGDQAKVGGGNRNLASGAVAVVNGGGLNVASGIVSTVGGGSNNTASGMYSTVPGGDWNEAAGAYSVAMGRRARALNDGSFVFADANRFPFESTAANSFRVRATGGARFVTAIDDAGDITESFLISSTGSVFSTGEIYAVAFNPTSDRNAKRDFAAVDAAEVLDAVTRLPLASWSYRSDPDATRHIGPTAQDFRAAFGVGRDEKSIATVDADGVALAAIQGLNAKLEAKVAEQARALEAQAREIAELRRMMQGLLAEGRMAAMR